MTPDVRHPIRLEVAAPRAIAAVHARLPIADVPRRFRTYLDQVYAAARDAALPLDGQNVFLYLPPDGPAAAGEKVVAFGVGVTRPFDDAGPVRCTPLPTGRVAATTHWGDYAALGIAHAAIHDWSRAEGAALAGPCWEVYGHWDADPARCRTDVYYLLAGAAS